MISVPHLLASGTESVSPGRAACATVQRAAINGLVTNHSPQACSALTRHAAAVCAAWPPASSDIRARPLPTRGAGGLPRARSSATARKGAGVSACERAGEGEGGPLPVDESAAAYMPMHPGIIHLDVRMRSGQAPTTSRSIPAAVMSAPFVVGAAAAILRRSCFSFFLRIIVRKKPAARGRRAAMAPTARLRGLACGSGPVTKREGP